MLDSSNKAASANPAQTLIWAFIPFCIRQGRLLGDSYDTADFKAELAWAFQQLGLPWIWQAVTHSNLNEVIAQVSASNKQQPVVVFNFCDGIDDPQDTPGLSVVHALEKSGLRFTGADARFFAISTSKIRMKTLFQAAGVATPPFAVVANSGPLDGVGADLAWPLFCKPDVSAASYGVTLRSVVHDSQALQAYREELKTGPFGQYFAQADFLAERFIQGPEFTLFVGGRWDRPESLWSLPPAERIFHPSIPVAERFLSFDRYWGHYQEESAPPAGEAFYAYRPCAENVQAQLTDLGLAAYRAARGHGYGRVDIRQDSRSGEYYVLEVNANCGLSGDDQTSLGNILKIAGLSFAQLLGLIVADAWSTADP